MKKIISLFLFLPIYLIANSISVDSIIKYKLSVKSKCINGFLYDEIIGKINGAEILVQQPTCIDVSRWDSTQCNHKPIKCRKENQK